MVLSGTPIPMLTFHVKLSMVYKYDIVMEGVLYINLCII